MTDNTATTQNNSSASNTTAADPAFTLQIAELIVHALNLDVEAGAIAPDEPLYGEGLGLDSIDILEVALVVSKNYGIQLRADQEDNEKIFSSLRSLSDYIAANRTQ
ncbi:MAG: phosphopantetheine-binding protein [Pseudomonadota bacterium]|jgi:acyl carrier protein